MNRLNATKLGKGDVGNYRTGALTQKITLTDKPKEPRVPKLGIHGSFKLL